MAPSERRIGSNLNLAMINQSQEQTILVIYVQP